MSRRRTAPGRRIQPPYSILEPGTKLDHVLTDAFDYNFHWKQTPSMLRKVVRRTIELFDRIGKDLEGRRLSSVGWTRIEFELEFAARTAATAHVIAIRETARRVQARAAARARRKVRGAARRAAR